MEVRAEILQNPVQPVKVPLLFAFQAELEAPASHQIELDGATMVRGSDLCILIYERI